MRICERCGLDEDSLGRWSDFVHYRADFPGKRVWCLPPEKFSPEVEKLLEEWAEEMAERAMKTLMEIYEL